jgi:hypothetical protein
MDVVDLEDPEGVATGCPVSVEASDHVCTGLTSGDSNRGRPRVSEDGTDGLLDVTVVTVGKLSGAWVYIRFSYRPSLRCQSSAINRRNRFSSGVSRFASQNRNNVKPKPRPNQIHKGSTRIRLSHKPIGAMNDAAIRNFLVIISPIRESRYANE